MQMRHGSKPIHLPSIREPESDWGQIEKELKRILREEIFWPIIKVAKIKKKQIRNSNSDDLEWAIHQGRLFIEDGQIKGKFTATLSKAIKDLGGKWDRRNQSFRIDLRTLPINIRHAVGMSEIRFQERLKKIDKTLATLSPEQITEKVQISDLFDRALFKVEKQFQENVKKITVPPIFSAERRKSVSKLWEENLKKNIKGWTAGELLRFRKDIRAMIYSGQRQDALAKYIQDRYQVAGNKAKFWARQETKLAMTAYAESRYQEAGVDWYKWQTVHDSKVRHAHEILDGRAFQFSRPPRINDANEHPARYGNAGTDYNCRCKSVPLVGYKGRWGDKV